MSDRGTANSDSGEIFECLFQLYILLTIVLTFDAIARYRQRHRRSSLSVRFNVHLVENRFPVLFEPFAIKNIDDETYEYDMLSYRQADRSMVEFLKYLCNFAFYRFGLEVSDDRLGRCTNYSFIDRCATLLP